MKKYIPCNECLKGGVDGNERVCEKCHGSEWIEVMTPNLTKFEREKKKEFETFWFDSQSTIMNWEGLFKEQTFIDRIMGIGDWRANIEQHLKKYLFDFIWDFLSQSLKEAYKEGVKNRDEEYSKSFWSQHKKDEVKEALKDQRKEIRDRILKGYDRKSEEYRKEGSTITSKFMIDLREIARDEFDRMEKEIK
jgi:gas vesicle protein